MRISKAYIVIVICFAVGMILLLTVLSPEGVENTQEPVVFDSGENATLQFELTADNALYISGSGTINSGDLERLATENEVNMALVENVFIGDGIIGIGHDCFTNMENLRGFKSGKDVRTILYNSVSYCPNLEYLWISKETERTGSNFLEGAEMAFILTDADEIISIPDRLNKGRVYTGVSDFTLFEDIEERYHKPVERYLAEDLGVTDFESLGYPLKLHNDVKQFGPYTCLDEGTYEIVVRGRWLDRLSPENIYVNVAGENRSGCMSDLSIDSFRITYKVTLDDYVEDVEFCISDELQEHDLVEIYGLDIYDDGSADIDVSEN